MLTQKQIDIILNEMKPYHPVKIGVFGSVSRGEETSSSDIDLLYQFRLPIGLFKLIKLKNDLEKKLGKDIDLVSEKYINSRLKPYVMRDIKVIYENK